MDANKQRVIVYTLAACGRMTAQRFLAWLGPGWTTRELAAKFAVERSTIRRWRRGAAVPKGEHARAIQAFQEYMRATHQVEMLGSDGSVQRESSLRLRVALDEAAAFNDVRRFPAPATFTALPEKKRRR